MLTVLRLWKVSSGRGSLFYRRRFFVPFRLFGTLPKGTFNLQTNLFQLCQDIKVFSNIMRFFVVYCMWRADNQRIDGCSRSKIPQKGGWNNVQYSQKFYWIHNITSTIFFSALSVPDVHLYWGTGRHFPWLMVTLNVGNATKWFANCADWYYQATT